MNHASTSVNTISLEKLPGAEVVLPGLADIEAGRKSVNASAVRSASTRLRKLGFNTPVAEDGSPAAHQLYRHLSEELGAGAAHTRYNAILERVASFARAAELAQRG
jgi:hypothetical protein